jgi:AcrR family transcriptional regulator
MSPRVSAERREQYLEERRNQILDAAIEVFGNKGLDVATVDEIAQTVGISKGTIYLYFKSKDEIFDAILAERSTLPLIVNLMEATKDLQESDSFSLQLLLEHMGNNFLSAIDKYYPLFRLLLADSHRFPVQAEHVYNNLILKANQMFAEFLSAQVKAGKIKALESPLITARCFIGMLIIYVLSQEILGGQRFTPIKRSEWVKETVRLFLEGVQISTK